MPEQLCLFVNMLKGSIKAHVHTCHILIYASISIPWLLLSISKGKVQDAAEVLGPLVVVVVVHP